MEVNMSKTPPMEGELLAIQSVRGEAPCDSWE